MKVYHGTSTNHLDSILQNGLEPRKQGRGNWKDFPSRPDMVYLSVAFPLYFATQSGGNPVVFEVDIDSLDLTLLHPDEDYISARLKAMDQRMAHEKIRQRLWKWQSLWTESLEVMGNCCYKGTIPPSALTRYAKWDHKGLPGLSSLASRQVVNVQGYLLVKPIRIGLIAWLFGDQPTMYCDPQYQPETESDQSKEQYEEGVRAISAKRDSIQVVRLRD